MKTVTFVKAWDMYFIGDSASFEVAMADKIIAAGVAKEYVPPTEAEVADKKKAAGKF